MEDKTDVVGYRVWADVRGGSGEGVGSQCSTPPFSRFPMGKQPPTTASTHLPHISPHHWDKPPNHPPLLVTKWVTTNKRTTTDS